MRERPSDSMSPGTTPPVLALRPEQAAKALGISPRLLWSLTNRGEVPHLRAGRAVLYPVADLEQWLSERVEMEGRQR